MAGQWIHRDIDVHRCKKPPYARDVRTGDRWLCECGTEWIVDSIGSDQRDPFCWINWKQNSRGTGRYSPGGIRPR